MNRRALPFLCLLLAAPLRAWFDVRVKSPSGEESRVPAEEVDGRIWLSLEGVGRALGASVELKTAEYVLTFASSTVVLDVPASVYHILHAGERKPKYWGLEDPAQYMGSTLMVSLRSLPGLLDRKFTYHRQRRALEEYRGQAFLAGQERSVPVRRVRLQQKQWYAVEDAARALGVVVFASQGDRTSLVMPDFAILQLRSEDPWVYRKQRRTKLLPDPVLFEGGTAYVTLESLNALFNLQARWDDGSQTLLLPALYGRLRELKPLERPPLLIIGYEPEPLAFSIDDAFAYYQAPGPVYAVLPQDIYESVRDYYTNRVMTLDTKSFQRVSGEAAPRIQGSLLGQPLKGSGRFEKLGTRGSLVNGSLEWGFPRFQVKAGREYLRVGGFANQSVRVDQAAVSVSNDAYGDNRADPEIVAVAMGGEDLFSVFVSTDFFSQTVVFRQKIAGGSLDVSKRLGDRHRLSLSFSQYFIENHVREIQAEFNSEGLFDLEYRQYINDLLGLGPVSTTVDTTEAQKLASSVLTPRHQTSVADAQYKWESTLHLTVTGAMSRSPMEARRRGRDGAWRARAVVGEKKSRLDMSYERTGGHFRSVGDPLRYQARWIERVAPYVDLGKSWKMYGEARREYSKALVPQGFNPVRTDYASLGNLFSFSSFALRMSADRYDSTRDGRRWSTSADHTQYLGRDSFDLGAAWSTQWFARDAGIYRMSYTGRAGFQILRPSWRLSIGEELTRNHYPLFRAGRWNADSHVMVQAGSWRTLAQYIAQPRHFLEAPDLYTGLLRLGHQAGPRKVVGVYLSIASLQRNLRDPEVWRAGMEYTYDFY